MSWFKRKDKKIKDSEKKSIPDGLWDKCPSCNEIIYRPELEKNLSVCHHCNHHFRVTPQVYVDLLLDSGSETYLFQNLESEDFLKFKDSKKYIDRLKDAHKKTGLNDAIRTAVGKSKGKDIVIAAMDFTFIGGSVGSVVGEKISRAATHALENKIPLIIISKSGGARMMEAGISLMQLAKTSAKLAQLSKAGLPYISLCTDPTFGGATASFSMLGDMNISEPNALIGFAGPRVVKETIGKDLPEGFQTAEFLQEHGFIDFIVNRKDLKEKLAQLFRIIKK